MALLFNRAVRLLVAPADPSAKPVDSIIKGAGADLSQLRTSFSVSRALSSDSDKAIISVYNASSETRGIMSESQMQVLLAAGYDGIAPQIFSGFIDHVSHRRIGQDWISEIEAGDGAEMLRSQKYKRAWPAKTKVGKIIEDMISQVKNDDGVPLAKRFIDIGTISEKPIDKGYSENATFREAMDAVAEAYKFKWCIQDGQFVALAANMVIDGDADAPLITPESGLLDAPERTDSGVNLTTLLDSRIVPGYAIIVGSQFLSAILRIETVTHTGDNKDGAFQSRAECVYLEAESEASIGAFA